MSNMLSNCELTFWNSERTDPPTVDAVRSHLSANGLNPQRAPDVSESTAFRRACDSFRSKELTVRPFVRKADSVLCCQFDKEIQDEGRLSRQLIAVHSLVVGEIAVTIECDRGTHVYGIEEAYMVARNHYTSNDVSKVIQAILDKDGLGAYTPKKNGGVYFVPVKPEAADLLTRIERFASALSVRFLRYQIPDTGVQREEIADAIGQSFADEITTHAEAIAEYSDGTKLGVIENRRTAIQATDASMNRLRTLMGGRYNHCRDQMRELLLQLAEVEKAIVASQNESANQIPEPAGRRILVDA